MKIYTTNRLNLSLMSDIELFKHFQKSDILIRASARYGEDVYVQFLGVSPYSDGFEYSFREVPIRNDDSGDIYDIWYQSLPKGTTMEESQDVALKTFANDYRVVRPIDTISIRELDKYLKTFPPSDDVEEF